jgi:hypothetical protein
MSSTEIPIYIYVALTVFNEDVPRGLDENDPVF